MAYYYNGQKILAPVTFLSNEPVYFTESVSLKQDRTSQGNQRWELEFDTLDREGGVDLLLGLLDERKNVATMIMPNLKEVDDVLTLSGTISANASAAKGVNTLKATTSGGSTGLIPKGVFIKFANHDKVYMVRTAVDITTLGSGIEFDLDIYPELHAAVPISTAANVGSGCVLTYYRDVDSLSGITFDDGILMNSGRVRLIEAL